MERLSPKSRMKFSDVLHVFSVIAGLAGLAMSAFAVLVWPADTVWFGVTREIMLLCSVTTLLAAIWLQLATMHHMMLEKRGRIGTGDKIGDTSAEQPEIKDSSRLSEKLQEHPLAVAGIFVIVILLAFVAADMAGFKIPQREKPVADTRGAGEQKASTPLEAVELPAVWGDLGAQMIAAGVIDRAKFETLYAGRGGLAPEEQRLLTGKTEGNIVVTEKNAGIILNLLWGLGLGNKNTILEKGQMTDSRYGGAGKFASTGGWTLAKGDAMKHYSAHPFITLTPKQQAMVESTSGNIYRPCCDNPAIFPDCNHGMAMLGLLELLASQGATEDQMYKVALQMNRFWFTGQYRMIDQYLASKGRVPSEVSPKEILGKEYSSASGFSKIASQVKGTPQGGGSCGA